MADAAPHLVITGLGLVSPLGTSAWATFRALLEGRTIADRATGLAELPGELPGVNLIRAVGSVSVAQHTATDPSVDLAERAAREALFTPAPGSLSNSSPAPPSGSFRGPCWVGASKGAVHVLAQAMNDVLSPADRRNQRREMMFPSAFPSDTHLAGVLGPQGYLVHHLRRRLGVNDVRGIAAACASSLTAVHLARTALMNADSVRAPRAALVVSSEAALLPAFIHSYRRLGVLPPLTPAGYRGRPLDRSRSGFLLSELAAAIVVQRVDHVEPGQIELLDTAIAAEGHDLVRAAPGMPALCRVAETLMAGRRIDLLHPHATGTVEHDPLEMAVHADVLRTAPPEAYAVKGALGHGLGAAGLVSLVVACLCAKARQRPPMPWLTDPIDCPLPLKTQGSRLRTSSTHAVFAAGFGGHVAGAVIRRV